MIQSYKQLSFEVIYNTSIVFEVTSNTSNLCINEAINDLVHCYIPEQLNIFYDNEIYSVWHLFLFHYSLFI